MTAGLAQARGKKAVIAVDKIDRLARDAGSVLKLDNEAEKNGMGCFIPTRRHSGDPEDYF